ncbi:MAG TPA: hypothetical protein VE756_10850, partial [Burkholderiales bacterium]|nr:hypothetical protein [Burkholderiales bacterium]
MRLAALLALIPTFVAAADADVAAWRAWLPQPQANAPSPTAAFVPPVNATHLRANRAWLERWTLQSPSLAWGDVVAELVVKYQQTPLRAARNFTYVHVAIHDALVLCARRGCERAIQPIAMHAAASRMLAHLYP